MTKLPKTVAALPLRALVALEYLIDRDAVVTSASSVRGERTFHNVRGRPTPEVPKPGGRNAADAPEIDAAVFKALDSRGLFDHPERADVEMSLGIDPERPYLDEARKVRASPFAWYETLSYPNEAARTTLEADRMRLAAHRAAEVDGDEGHVILRRSGGRPGAGIRLKVVSRTDRRVQVQPDAPFDGAGPVRLHGGDRYVLPEDVLAEGVDGATWRRLLEVTAHYDARVSTARASYDEALRTLRASFDSAEAQARAELDDDMASLLPSASPSP